jgi:NitT/TauT family transport system substrate-binding protein
MPESKSKSILSRVHPTARGAMLAAVGVTLIFARVLWRQHTPTGGLLGRPLRVGLSVWPGYAGGFVENKGLEASRTSAFFKNHDLLVQFVIAEDTKARLDGLARGGDSGGLDMIWSTVDSWPLQFSDLKKRHQPIDAHAVLQVDWSQGGDALVATAEIEQIQDLRNKVVVLARSTPSEWLLYTGLKNSPLSVAEVKQVLTSAKRTNTVGEALHEFVEGNVNAAVLWEPSVTRAIKQRPGTHSLFATDLISTRIADIIVVRGDFAESHKRAVSAFIAGWLEGTEAANRDPGQAGTILTKMPAYQGLSEEEVRRSLAWVKYATLEENIRMFGIAGEKAQFDTIFSESVQLWRDLGYMNDLPDPLAARDNLFLRQYHASRNRDVQRNSQCEPELTHKDLPVHFKPRSAELDETPWEEVENTIAGMVSAYAGLSGPLGSPQISFCISGGTETTGDPYADASLSAKRAISIVRRLKERGGAYNLVAWIENPATVPAPTVGGERSGAHTARIIVPRKKSSATEGGYQ